jgi:hypothetical protein
VTLIVGILCKDGAVIAADSAATLGPSFNPTVEQQTTKIHVVSGHVLVAGTGMVGFDQRFGDVIMKTTQNGGFRSMDALAKGKAISKAAILDFNETLAAPGSPIWGRTCYGAMVAYMAEDAGTRTKAPQICQFDAEKFQPELVHRDALWWATMGGGAQVADPVLALLKDIFWSTGGPPTLASGIFAAVWTMQHAIATNTGGVNGPYQIAVLDPKKNPPADLLKDTDEHVENVNAAKKHFREFEKLLQEGAAASATETPKL